MRSGWEFIVEPGMADGMYGLTMDVDPAHRTLRFGLSLRSGGTNELGNGAVARLPFVVEQTDWADVERWLASTEAHMLLAEISSGYSGETLWSGDRVGRWSPAAMDALRALYAAIEARV